MKSDCGIVRITPATMEEALRLVESWVLAGAARYACFCEASLLSRIPFDARLASAVEKADAVFADGVAVKALAALYGVVLKERVSGPSFMLQACEYGVPRGWRHFLLGAAPGVGERLAGRLRSRFPGIEIVGVCSPPFRNLTDREESDLKSGIETARPHLLWVALGSPKQEQWVADHAGRIDVPVTLPVGAAFDFHSGARSWAPRPVRALGLEWLFRMLTGGRRTFARNLRCVPVVGALLVREFIRVKVLRRGRRRTPRWAQPET